MTQQVKPLPPRHQQLLNWLQPWLSRDFQALTQVAGDASFRCYYRLHATENTQGNSLIVMDAPPEKESSDAFLHLAQVWHREGIAVPKVLDSCARQGFALLEDFGDLQLMQAVAGQKPQEADPFYRQALRQLAEIQDSDPLQTQQLPDYDAPLLKREMALFDDWLLGDFLQLNNRDRPARWKAFQQELVNQALIQPKTRVHRDYHSRNLMVTDGEQLGILDFQDAVYGPLTYDAVSLIRDCYLAWPQNWQQTWLNCFYDLTRPPVTLDEYRHWFDWMGMQRHLKAAGIFARLWLRDGKAGYLADLPRTLDHLTQALQNYPDWADINLWLRQEVQPRLQERLQLLKDTPKQDD
ncbi:phosphotransferase [Marinospirillum sp.]|uniref:aminoglycoside phosphotransferase family protein n=1 Tax=Marinospirillum sp. TaxID=2183934 RepID=UPI0028707D01|nr:phosphotransferase [Marinospirillum sp.]MDR9466642.1 phosphotransferase [Marinospirillum sp.]